MDILIWIIIGALAGWVASMIMKRDGQMGAVANIIVGIIGAFVGGWVLSLFGQGGQKGELNIASFLTALLGAVIVLAILNLIQRGRAR